MHEGGTQHGIWIEVMAKSARSSCEESRRQRYTRRVISVAAVIRSVRVLRETRIFVSMTGKRLDPTGGGGCDSCNCADDGRTGTGVAEASTEQRSQPLASAD